jgi:PIN domain nuclease of toxin-antitoxin system
MATTDAQRATTVTTTQLAKIILLSERRIQQLVRAGILKHAYDEDDGHELRGRFQAIPNVQAYIRYLRQELGSEDMTETRFLDARSRRMLAMASAEELRLDVLRGKLHRAEDVEYFMTNRDSEIRIRLLAISSRVTRLLVGQSDPNAIRTIIDAEILAVLDELVVYDPIDLREECKR